MTSEIFLLITCHGQIVHEFDEPEKARQWVQQRKKSTKGYCPNLILIKKTTTVIEEILDYV